MSSLTDWHEQADAEMQDYSGTPIVGTYGRLPLEYAAMFRSCAIMDMAHRGVLSVNGPERLAFLNGLLTNELISRDSGDPLPAGETRFAFLLDRKGRIQSEMLVVNTGDSTLLVMDARLVESTAKELEKYRFREKVDITPAAATRVMGVFGPEAAGAIAAWGGPVAGELANAKAARIDSGWVYRDDLGDCAAMHVLVDDQAMSRIWVAAVNAGAVPIGWAAYNAVRIEARRPVLGIDFDSTFLPAETGQLSRSVSFTKGCYPGQEIVARMRSRDQCSRQVAMLRMPGDAMPLAGEKVLDNQHNEVGLITSSTISPRQSGIGLCLAILKKPWFEEGRVVNVPAEGEMREAKVV